jgi:hypothetical protein
MINEKSFKKSESESNLRLKNLNEKVIFSIGKNSKYLIPNNR